jgi:hypothetical protein
MNGWGCDAEAIKALTKGASDTDKQAVLKDAALISRLSSELSRADMLAVLGNLNAPLKDKLNAAMNGWGCDAEAIKALTKGASDTDKQAVLADTVLVSRLSSELSPEDYKAVMLNLGVAIIGDEQVKVASETEAKEAERIIKTIQAEYGIDVSSKAGVDAIKKQYTRVPDAVKDQLTTTHWEYKELVALEKALKHFAPILGEERKSSSRKDKDQEVTSVSKVKQAIDKNTASGQLDTTTLGEYFKQSKNFSMFSAGTNSTTDFSDNNKQLEGTAIHEIAHGLLKHEVTGYAKALDYWKDEKTPSGKAGAEQPITTYGQTNASEDLSEAVMYYFVEQNTLKTKCPQRYNLIESMVKLWKNKPNPSKKP